MTNLYQYQEKNIRRTWMLFTSFLVLVIGLGWVFSYVFQSPGILVFAVLFSVATSLLSYWYSDKIALMVSRAAPIEKKDNPQLWNIIENLTIAAGLPMPKVYVTPERQINAFATGRDPQHAVIAVTQGALDRLSKTELEGVLSHELAHIGNRDILISTVAVVLAGVISLLADFFMRSLIFGGGRDRDNRAAGVFVLVGFALSILAPLGAMLMRLAISRRRESLADATGALITRYPEGLAAALEKIAADQTPMRAAAHDATAHLWIANPFKGQLGGFHRLFMSHPPIEERIAALRGMKM